MPHRQAAQVVADLVQALLGVPTPWGVCCWDGSEAPGPPGAPTLVVTSPRALRRIIYSRDELGLARAYVSGDVEVDGDLFRMLEFPDSLLARPSLHLDRSAFRRLLGDLVRNGVLGLPVPPPPEESRLRGLRHSLRRDRAAISHHYDVGNDFYALLLGPTMVYSCAYFATPATTLDDAQRAKLDLVCRKLDLRPGMRLLDVGCGWGSLVLHAAAASGVHAVGVTISAEQAHLARRRVKETGLDDRVEIRVQDYREVRDGPYDAVASVGMAEHVGVLERAGFEVRDVEGLREHYALTCRAWVANLEAHWDDALRVVSPARARVWRLYLAGSALSFERRRVGVNQILATKAADRAGAGSWPMRRPDWSGALEDHGRA